MSQGPPFAERLIEEGRELYEAARDLRLDLRLMGGVGIRLLLGERLPPAYRRSYRDLDVMVRRKQRRDVETLLAKRGWEPATEFNALGGGRRLLFHDPASEAQVDVFVESFEMCHSLPLVDGLDRPGPSLPATDLLMSKLQIVSLNTKDRNDCYALLESCTIAEGDHEAIELSRIAGLAAGDWGIHHTFELNLRRLREGLGAVAQADAEQINSILDQLCDAIDEVPKTRAWKLRAKIGERKRWYEEPEEVDRAGNG